MNRVYETAWRGFEQWCHERDLSPLPATEQTVVNYVAYLAEETDCAPSTVRVRLAALKWTHRSRSTPWSDGVLVQQAVRALERDRLAAGRRTKSAPPLTPGQAELLLAAADADGLLPSALLALMLYTGARIGELLSADVSDIIQEAGIPVLRIVGKGRKRRSLPVIPAVYVRLERYLAGRQLDTVLPALPGQGGRALPLFATRHGRRIDPRWVRRVLLRCATRAGLEAEVVAQLTPHSTRATYATSNLAAGTPLRDVQYALGHEDPRTTEGYDRSDLQLDRHPSTRLAAVIRPPSLPDSIT